MPKPEAASPSTIALRLLGVPALVLPDGTPVPLTGKDSALLAVLALHGPTARDALCALLWPEAGPRQAMANLRQRRKRLHDVTGSDLVTQGGVLRLADGVTVDTLQMDSLSAAELLACGELLAGMAFGELAELDEWLGAARLRMADRQAQAMAARAEELMRSGDLRTALPLAAKAVQLAPLAEHAARRLMRLHYLRGDRGAALAAFERLSAAMLEELDAQPSLETLQLWQTIESAVPCPPLPHRPVPASVMLPPVMVGRVGAWHGMAQAWQQGRPFLLIGEAGLGKSRLLQEFLHGREGVVQDKARPGDEQLPYAVLGRMLWAVQQRYAVHLPEPTRRELGAIHPEVGPAWPMAARPEVLRHAVQQFFHAAAAAGLAVLALDDMHDSDLATLETLRWLAQGAHPCPCLFALALRPPRRPEIDALTQAWLNDSQPPAKILLAPLSQDDLAALLATLALPGLVDPAVTAQLYRHAGGHPLYTLATLQDALTHGRDLRQPKLPDPPSVQALLDARLAELPAATSALLQVAAVGGDDLSMAHAATLLGCEPLKLAADWRLLEAANVLRGERFTHDLVHEAALRAVPLGLGLDLHRRWAALLQQASCPALGRIAWHWEQGERWTEAGRAWHAAGAAARQAGRLVEQTALFEHAARCHALAGDGGARFDALFARLDGLQLHQGGAAVLAVLPELEALADTSSRRLRCLLARAEALLDGEQAQQALASTQRAMDEVARHPDLLADAGALHAMAMAQCSRHGPALTAARLARESAGACTPEQLRATQALSYVLYSSGRLAEAVPVQRDAVVLAERLGDRSEAAAAEGHLAALLASVGDVAATHRHAVNAHRRHQAVGLGDNSTLGIVNHFIRGSAAAYLGRFDEALDALQTAVALSANCAVMAAQAKARLALAGLWLTFGQPAPARALVEDLPEGLAPALKMQACLLMSRAAALDNAPQRRYGQALAALAAGHAQLPLVQSAWYEASFQGDAATAVTYLARVRGECEQLGLHGTARSLHLRELARWLDLDGDTATAEALHAAQALLPHASAGMSAKVYPPQACLTLAQAFERAGRPGPRDACLDQGRQWLANALPSVPEAQRQTFAALNPVNRLLLGQ